MAESDQKVIMLRDVRTSYFYGHEPYVNVDAATGKTTKSYSSHFLLPPDHPQLKEIQDAMIAAAKAAWKDDWQKLFKAFQASGKTCLRKGDDAKPGEAAYEGMWFVSAGNGAKPFTMVETRGDKNVILTPADGRPYSGCYVNAKIAIWAQDNKFGKRINAQLQGVQYLRRGEAFGGGTIASADEFGLTASDADVAIPGESAAASGGDENLFA